MPSGIIEETNMVVKGLKGDEGERGGLGPTGNQGSKGDQGVKGDRGIIGPQGVKGEIGVTGNTGEQGPLGPMSGVVKVSTPIMPKGIAVHKTQGRNLPQRVFVRSAMAPIMGSLKASQILEIRNIVPATFAEIPKTSV